MNTRLRKCPTLGASSREDDGEQSRHHRRPGRRQRRRLHIYDAQSNTSSSGLLHLACRTEKKIVSSHVEVRHSQLTTPFHSPRSLFLFFFLSTVFSLVGALLKENSGGEGRRFPHWTLASWGRFTQSGEKI